MFSRAGAHHILALDISGQPFDWMSIEEAARYYTSGRVAWDLGDESFVLHGGFNRHGERSSLMVKPIFAIQAPQSRMGRLNGDAPKIGHRNELLFRRDRCMCAYCGEKFSPSVLTRDHVHPRSRGGKDVWENCVTACMPCNNAKDARTPEEWGRRLLYVPYRPCRWEHVLLQGRNVLADQMSYLSAKLPSHSRLLICH